MDRALYSKGVLPPGLLAKGYLQVAEHLVDCGALRILNRDPMVRLPPKAFGVLLVLARSQGETVARDTLLDTVWAETCPTPDVVKQAVLELRRAFEPDDASLPIIETIPKLGYRLVAPVRYSETLPFPDEDSLSEGEAAPAGPAPTAVPTEPVSAARQVRAVVFATVVLALVAGAFWMNRRTEPSPVASSAAMLPVNFRLLTSDLGMEVYPAVSPDGMRVAFAAMKDRQGAPERIGIKAVSDNSGSWLTGAEGDDASWPVWSPDGSRLAYLDSVDESTCHLVSQPILGGEATQIADCWSSVLQLFDWSPDGKSIALSQRPDSTNPGGQIKLLDLATLQSTALAYAPGAGEVDLEPRFSPDGARLAFRRGIQPYNDLYLYDFRSRKLQRLTQYGAAIRGFTWTPSGRFLIFCSNHLGNFGLYALEPASGRVIALGIEDAEYPSVARHAPVLAFSKTRVVRKIVAVSIRDAGKPPAAIAANSTGSDRDPVLSDDGRLVALVSNRTGRDELWTGPLATGSLTQATSFSGERLAGTSWLDPQSLLVIAYRGTRSRLYLVDLQHRRQQSIAMPDVYVRQVVAGGAPGRFWLIARRNVGPWQLWRGELAAGAMRLTDTGIAATAVQFDRMHAEIYLQRQMPMGLAKLDESLQNLTALPDLHGLMAIRIRAGSLWFLSNQRGGVSIGRIGLVDGKQEMLRQDLMVEWLYPQFDVSPDERQVFVTTVDRDDTDVAVATLPEALR